MVSVSKIQTQRIEPTQADILQAIRETLIAAPRANKLAVGNGEAAQSDSERLADPPATDRPASVREQLHNAPSIACDEDSVTEEVDNGPVTGRAAASVREELHNALRIVSRGGSVADVDDAPRIASIREQLYDAPMFQRDEELEHAPPLTEKPAEVTRDELPDAPSISIVEPPIDLTFRPAGFPDAELPAAMGRSEQASVLHSDLDSHENRLFTRPTFRIVTRGVLLIAAITIAFAFLPIVRTDLSQVSSMAGPTAQTPTQTGDAVTRSDFPPAVAAVAPASIGQHNEAATPVSELAALRHQLEGLAAKQDQLSQGTQDQLRTMVSDVAALRRSLEKLAARQDEMAAEIAQLQTAKKNLAKRFGVHTRSHR
jgi:hypothetical protein